VLGYANAYFITDTGKVYGCGYSGALCLGQQTKDQLTPVLIRGFPSDVTICDIAIGSSTHTLFLSTTGEVYGCGIDHVSNLCLPNDVDTSMVQRLPR